MAQTNQQSAGVTTREIDLSGPRLVQPTGIPAGVIGTATKGPAFVPVTLAVFEDFIEKFGELDGESPGPYAVSEWLKNASAVTFLRLLGAGDGKQRSTTGANQGNVTNAGFVVGQQLPNTTAGAFGANPYANAGGSLGRLYFLGCYMSDSSGATTLTNAGIQSGPTAAPIIRGVLMAPDSVILRLSSSNMGSTGSVAPASTLVATNTTASGSLTGSIVLLGGSGGTTVLQEFTMLLNGHKGTTSNPNVITASFDTDAENYFGKVFNTDPTKIEQAGHLLYARYDIHSALAVPTGSGILSGGAEGKGHIYSTTQEEIAFLVTGSQARNVGTTTIPSYENFEDRFRTPRTPFFTSQAYGGTMYDLFRLEAISDGAWANDKIKVSIENIAPSTDSKNKFGTFDVVVRDFADTDTNKIVLESYRGCSLDQSSDKFVAKMIGDQKVFFDFDKKVQSQKLVLEGSYENQSNYVRVVLGSKIRSSEVPEDALPVGFRGPDHLVTSGSDPLTNVNDTVALVAAYQTSLLKRAVELPVPMRNTISVGTGGSLRKNADLYWGVQFELAKSATELNASTRANATIASMAKYFPQFQTSNMNVSTGSNPGAAVTSQNGVVDCDAFNNNRFSLEKIQVVTASGDVADTTNAQSWSYVRNGSITPNAANKTRAFDASKDLATAELRALFKFSTFLQGGFDGVNIFDTDMAKLTDRTVRQEMDNVGRGTTSGPAVSAWRKGVTVMENTSDVDIKLLTTPGIRHQSITDYTLDAVKNRFDALYVMDIEEYDSLNAVMTASLPAQKGTGVVSVKNTVTAFKARALDTNFGAAYFPDVIINDPSNGNVQMPASVAVLGAYSLNDRIGREWFAPAGNTRGVLASTIDTTVKLNQSNLDNLYSADINPLVSKPNDAGAVVFGQKTLQAAQTALDRVNVRRLLIFIRRQVREVANAILFEPNRASTLAKFSAAVEPRLANVQAQRGLERYKVKIDTETTTQEDVENNTIRGKIWVQPTRTAEFVSIDFVVTNAGAQV